MTDIHDRITELLWNARMLALGSIDRDELLAKIDAAISVAECSGDVIGEA